MTRKETRINVKCHACGYEWLYGGKLSLATCSNCNTKTPVNKEEKA